ncbi:MAG: rhodanese-like domain-containing protein [Candidatus Moraniibacteriota bacterium]
MNSKEKKENKIIFFGILLIVVVLCFTLIKSSLLNKTPEDLPVATKTPTYSDYKYITSLELNTKIIAKEDLAILDIRDAVNFEKNHIQKSINLSPENFEKTISELNKDNLVVVVGYDYDKMTDVSAVIKKLKIELNFKNVLALTGGIKGWAEEGTPLIGGGDKESALDWSKVDYIIPEQLKLALEGQYPVFVLDVRLASQYSTGHIPGAVNIPLAELEKRKSELPVSKEILVYGANNDDDFKASVKLNDLGLLATYTLRGGFAAWQEKRFEIVK